MYQTIINASWSLSTILHVLRSMSVYGSYYTLHLFITLYRTMPELVFVLYQWYIVWMLSGHHWLLSAYLRIFWYRIPLVCNNGNYVGGWSRIAGWPSRLFHILPHTCRLMSYVFFWSSDFERCDVWMVLYIWHAGAWDTYMCVGGDRPLRTDKLTQRNSH